MACPVLHGIAFPVVSEWYQEPHGLRVAGSFALDREVGIGTVYPRNRLSSRSTTLGAGISTPCSAATATSLLTSSCPSKTSGLPPLVEWDFALQVLRPFERGSTTWYRVAVRVYDSCLPNPASRARTIACARSITCSFVKMLVT
jgi:hypothetical protein